jgi:hypothetical protein
VFPHLGQSFFDKQVQFSLPGHPMLGEGFIKGLTWCN